LQVTLCDPYLSALSVRYFNKGAIYIRFLYLFYLLLHCRGETEGCMFGVASRVLGVLV